MALVSRVDQRTRRTPRRVERASHDPRPFQEDQDVWPRVRRSQELGELQKEEGRFSDGLCVSSLVAPSLRLTIKLKVARLFLRVFVQSSILISMVVQLFLIGRSFLFSRAIDGPAHRTRRYASAGVKTFFALLAFSAGFGMQAEFNHFTNL